MRRKSIELSISCTNLSFRGVTDHVETQDTEDPQSPSGSLNEYSGIETPSKSRDTTKRSGSRRSQATRTPKAAQERDVRQRQYCTQAYLLGLARKRRSLGTKPAQMSLNILCIELATLMHGIGRLLHSIYSINLEKALIIDVNRLESKALGALCSS